MNTACSPGVLVVGAGQAGVQLAAALREGGYDGAVTLVGAEPHPPYQRPPLSKAYLSGTETAAGLALRSAAFYRDNDIRLLCSTRITDVALDTGCADTEDGEVLRFDRLALTTGARVRRLRLPGSDAAGIRYLRDVADGDLLAADLSRARSVVVVGGGFIGLEAAAGARARGLAVTVVEAAPRLAARVFAPVVSEFFRAAHERRGTRVLLGRALAAIETEGGHVTAVRLDDGRRLPADLVVVGIGVTPRAELAERLSLATAQGAIVVDGAGRTSDPRVVAAGDCTVQPHPQLAGTVVRLESVQNAVDQARVAAETLLGRPGSSATVPWFWSDQADLKLQIAGLSVGHDDVVVRGEPDSERFSVLYYRQDRLIAADCVNRAPDFLAVRRALATGATIDATRAGDDEVPLKDLVAAGTAR